MEVRLYVVSHKKVNVPTATYLYEIRSDSTNGINIAQKTNYCELRAQYWVWKNEILHDDDYVGFFHYRRYLELGKNKLIRFPIRKKRPVPYRIEKSPDSRMYSNPEIEDIIKDFDVIAPVWEYNGVSVFDRYRSFSGQRGEDLEMICQIISEKYPGYLQAAERYLNGKGEYYGNIYIMKWKYFKDYCAWLFDILDEFDRRTETAMPHADGFLGERLFGIYFTWLSCQNETRCTEALRLHFSDYDDAKHFMKGKRFLDLCLKPGSRMRGEVRSVLLRLKRKGYYGKRT